MKSYIQLLILCMVLGLGQSCADKATKKEETKATWYKGNLHTHTYWSDGDEFPEVVLDWYKAKDYDFVALTDHNTIAEGEKWKIIANDSIYQNAFKNYLETYGEDWVEYKIDSGRTHVKLKTYQEYRDYTEEKGAFLVIRSEEITDKYEGKHMHMNATNIQSKISPQGGNSMAEVMQNNIDAVLQQRQETGVPIMPHINHPNFHYSITLDDMISLRGERFFEVYNGHPSVHNMGDSTHISTEKMWDMINISYIEAGKPLMYGLATDDSHQYHRKGNKWSNAGRGWVMVQADTLSAKSLILSMEAGNFYATTGVTLKKVEIENKELAVAVEAEEGVSYSISFIGCKKGETEPMEFKKVAGIQGSFTITNDILFVRSKITSSKLQDNPIENILYESAWTQPIVIK
ncbi:histidinol-phosphatase [Cellulophaga sp. F20128]|uniref:PHP domain-containing protein n=1 Tax=Cellulophaga sp. F20128 TaxID=2926413 RepID=UPI001FF1B060|nr:histidinol-phosphatase [Cellulophaga sp. F20128]MCK0158789.1 histidinol-phosphatase [Cellulophaga sp. F20128]